ncbi:MAG: beta-lactamase family protein [Pyrinomonadaceae bacterium]|nr:beta-lactamase family protein [Pyrinomonadaceae bacterium]MCX7639009.1 beta-lactamase family protein [Pyrinomonadaceae bacterium]MDW8303771.1 serine hydrolase domain-containing protein [Acidobacteriota bacterium]
MFSKSNKLSGFLEAKISEGLFPSAVYLVAQRGKIKFADSLGYSVIEPEKISASLKTIYDLASLTKPLVVGLLCALLLERNEIRLEDRLANYFSKFDTEDKRQITVRHLLTHTTGFRSWMPFYLLANSRDDILRIIASEKLAAPFGTKVIYSDLNFIVLANLLELIYEKPLEEIVKSEIISPLELERTFFNPPKQFIRRIAASEKGNQYERQVCLEQGYLISQQQEAFFRNYVIWGEVHDGNCWFMGGVSGHAGLFSCIFETMKIAQQFLPEETLILKPETCRLFRLDLTEELNESRSISFQLAKTKNSVAYGVLSSGSFGHLGFTGTSLWIDPRRCAVFILFTNRTHTKCLPFANINPVRRKFLGMSAKLLASSSG